MTESKLRFVNPFVKSLQYNLLESFEQGKPVKIHNQFNVTISKAESSNEAMVDLKITVDETSENSPFSFEIVMASFFKWDDCYDEITVNNLLSINAPALLLGYARPIISVMTSSCPGGAYNLPFYNFVNQEKKD